MNYRHAFHAGNHGDVLKHIVLARVIEHLKMKDKGFLLLDAHAGIGAYALDGAEAEKTREWEQGVKLIFHAHAARGDEIARLLAPWRACITALNPRDGLLRYPGSPEIARQLLRPQDRMVFNELHPADHATLAMRYGGDRRVTVPALDAAAAVKQFLPPLERRGLVLIDPAYEAVDEAERVLSALREGLGRFATGVFLIWYPVVDASVVAALETGAAKLAPGKVLLAELRLRAPQLQRGLVGSGLVIVNAPWLLEQELGHILPFLLAEFETSDGAGFRIRPA